MRLTDTQLQEMIIKCGFQPPALWASQLALVIKNPSTNEGDIRDVGSIPDLGRAPGKGMATHLAWRIPWTEEPGGLQSMGSQRVRHD